MIIMLIFITLILILMGILIHEDFLAAGMVVGILFFIIVGVSAFCHANDLGKIRAQKLTIKVYEEKVAGLKSHIDHIVTTKPSLTLFNADSPLKSMVDQLSKGEADIARAKETLAKAEISIVERKAGPLWFVVVLYGDK